MNIVLHARTSATGPITVGARRRVGRSAIQRPPERHPGQPFRHRPQPSTPAGDAPMSNPEPPLYTVTAFCTAHHIARSFLYLLLREGRGPRVMKLGRRTFITREAAADWRARMEQETAAISA